MNSLERSCAVWEGEGKPYTGTHSMLAGSERPQGELEWVSQFYKRLPSKDVRVSQRVKDTERYLGRLRMASDNGMITVVFVLLRCYWWRVGRLAIMRSVVSDTRRTRRLTIS